MNYVETVKAFANANYEVNGWDIVVECYADAVSLMQEWVKPQMEQRDEICAQIEW